MGWNAMDGASRGVSITEMPYETVNICSTPSDTVKPFFGDMESSTNISDGVPIGEPCFFYQPKQSIVALLVHGKRLTAIVSEDVSYLADYSWTFSSSSSMEAEWPKIIRDFTNLTIRVYDISSIPSDGSPLKLLAKSENPMKASYSTAVSNKNTDIIVVTSSFDMLSVMEPLLHYNSQYCGLNATEYTNIAVETALNQTETFVEHMLEELQLQLDGTCDSIIPVSTNIICVLNSVLSLTSVSTTILMLLATSLHFCPVYVLN